MEPWGRIGSGIVELFAAILILFPKTTWLGSLLAIGVMSGAIFFHLAKLGLIVKDDGGQLFFYALLVFFSSWALLIIHWEDVKLLLKYRRNTCRQV